MATRTALDQMVADLPPDGRKILQKAELRFYQATFPTLSAIERKIVAQYLVALQLILDAENARLQILQPDKPGTPADLANRAEAGARLWKGVADLIDRLKVPAAYTSAHNNLLAGLRQLAEVDRRGAAELRQRGNLKNYATGESDRQTAMILVQSAVSEIARVSDAYFPPGLAVELLTTPPD